MAPTRWATGDAVSTPTSLWIPYQPQEPHCQAEGYLGPGTESHLSQVVSY